MKTRGSIIESIKQPLTRITGITLPPDPLKYIMPAGQLFSHGFLILDKPVGISSAKAVSEVKRLLKCKKIGHGGTLDPLASGILPLAIGEATKAFDYIAASEKEYHFTITFGEERTTDDAEGDVSATTGHIPAKKDILEALPGFTGLIMQTPPVYSALNINGRRAYQIARAGEIPEMRPRPVNIIALNLLSFSESRHATLSVACGKGTYVRALARDIARKCNSLGYISMLRRVSVGKFNEKKAILLDKLPELVHNATPLEAWIPIELALDDIPAIDLYPDQAQALRHGKQLPVSNPDGKYMVLYQGRILALAEIKSGVLRSNRIFNIN